MPRSAAVADLPNLSETLRTRSRAELFSLIFSAALLSGCWGGVSRHVLATVLSIQGEALYQRSEHDKAEPLSPKTNPQSRSVLRTSHDAEVSLALLPGALVQISGDSEVSIEELLLAKDGNETEDGVRNRTARIRLNRGSISVVFERRDDSNSRFAIVTPAVIVTANEDCVCHLHVDNAKTRVTCARGKAYGAANASEPVIIKAGYFQEWPGDGTRAATDEAAAQGDVADALEAEGALQQLQREQLKRRPF